MESRRNYSAKRQAVLRALCATKEHPTAEMLYNSLKHDYPDISLGTVYRNLSVLVEDGAAITVCNVNGKERYDGRTDNHPHFICRSCGKVFDAEQDISGDSIARSFEMNSGNKVDAIVLNFYGVCRLCGTAQK